MLNVNAAGMIGVTLGVTLLLTVALAPRYGLIRRMIARNVAAPDFAEPVI
jgi:hypothetical protein